MKRQKGITLVALVITIVIMLILISVTVTYSISEGGIIGKAKDSGSEYEQKDIYEQMATQIAYTKRREIDVAKTYKNVRDKL